MAFTKKKIDLTFKLGKNGKGDQTTFTEGDYTTVKFSGLRTQVRISGSGGAEMGEAQVRVFGLTLSQMNQLGSVVRVEKDCIENRFNSLQIEAGDDESGMAIIFQGQISMASIDMNGAPDSSLTLLAHAGYFEAVKSAPPLSYPVPVDVAEIMATLAKQNGYTFENNGVSVILSRPYLHGSPRAQMESCATAAGINWTIDCGTLAIWPKGGVRRTEPVPIVSAKTGMVGYPTSWYNGVAVTTLFNPRLQLGKICEVESILSFANGRFGMFAISHDLETEIPNGAWFTSFQGGPFNV